MLPSLSERPDSFILMTEGAAGSVDGPFALWLADLGESCVALTWTPLW